MWQDYIEKYKDKKVKLIVAGSREFNDRALATKWLDFMLSKHNKEDIVILDGGARGADKIGGDYGRERGIDVWKFDANWDDITTEPVKIKYRGGSPYNALAGINRNKDMGNNGTHLLAFNLGTSGTNDMIKYSTKLGLVVKEVKL
jgi:hypothetical protein